MGFSTEGNEGNEGAKSGGQRAKSGMSAVGSAKEEDPRRSSGRRRLKFTEGRKGTRRSGSEMLNLSGKLFGCK